MHRIYNRWNQFGDWVWRLAVLNLLWIVTTVVGLGFITVFPALSAVFAMVRQYHLGHKVHVVKDYFKYVKQDFVKANILGYSFLAILLILWVDYRFLLSIENYWLVTLSVIFLVAFFVSFVVMLISYVMFVHYQLAWKDYFLNGYRFIILYIKRTALLVALLILFAVAVSQFPGLAAFYGVAVPAYITVRIVLPVLSEDYQKQGSKQYEQEDILYY